MSALALQARVPLVVAGVAGGKRRAERVEVTDLADATHDPLLASLRQRLRREHGAPRRGSIGITCVFSREAVSMPPGECDVDGTLGCAGYGSSVTVTATFGFVAAAVAIETALRAPGPAQQEPVRGAAILSRSADGLLAQSVEQRTFNPLVAGSNPAQPTTDPVVSDTKGS